MCFWHMSCEVGAEDKCTSCTYYCVLQTTGLALIIMVTAAVNDVMEMLVIMQLLEQPLPLFINLYMHKHF